MSVFMNPVANIMFPGIGNCGCHSEIQRQGCCRNDRKINWPCPHHISMPRKDNCKLVTLRSVEVAAIHIYLILFLKGVIK